MNETIRKALLSDIAPLLGLINGYASEGIMLPRTEFEMAENIRDFTVAVEGTELTACGALHFYGPKTGEVRSLAVHPDRKGLGAGRRIVEALEDEARAHGLESVFAFTNIPKLFDKLGFVEVERRTLPSKVWKDCLRCPKLHCCDEIAMQKLLGVVRAVSEAEREALESNGLVVVPTVAR